MTCRSGVPKGASMSCNSAPLPFSFTPSAHSLPALGLQAPASHGPQTQPPLSSPLFPPTLTPTSLTPSSCPLEPLLSHLNSTLLPSVQSALPSGDTAAAFAPLDSNPAGDKPGYLAGQPGAGQRLYGTAPMLSIPLYSADAYSFMTGSLPSCSTWPQQLTDITRPNPAMPQADLPLSVGPGLNLGLGKLPRSRNSSDDDGSSINSDPAALVEDALLGELFFAQPEACQVLL